MAPQLTARQWVADLRSLDQALAPERQILSGTLSTVEWRRFEKLPWIFENGVAVLHADTVRVRSVLTGDVEVSINAMAKIAVLFNMSDSLSTWRASTIFTRPLDLLTALSAQSSSNFSDESLQVALSAQIGLILTGLYAEWELPGLEEKLAGYALSIGKLVHDFHSQWGELYWSVRTQDSEPLPSGGYRWQGQAPLHSETLRLLYYLTQSFSFIDRNDGVLWIKPPPSKMQALDLTFLPLRLFSGRDSTKSVERSLSHKRQPLNVATQAAQWLAAVKSCGLPQRAVTDDVYLVIWNVAVLIDCLPRISKDFRLEWSAIEARGILCDVAYRSDLIARIPVSALGHEGPLDSTLVFWSDCLAAPNGADGDKLLEQAWHLVRDYFAFLDAKKLGLGLPMVNVFRDSDVTRVRRRLQGSEALKKVEPLLTLLEDSGPAKFSAPAIPPDDLAPLFARFPNFKAVLSMIQKQLRLARLQSNPMFTLHPILLVGDPGWGKTRFLHALSAALGLPYTEIPMSSVTAGFVLGGADMMWHSAKQGRIADVFLHGSCINPMVVLDELDKGGKDSHHDSYGPLYQLLERHTAARFVDEALSVPLDSQHICWFATANSTDVIPAPILDRFEAFPIGALTPQESEAVAQFIYSDLLLEHSWGGAFAQALPSEVGASMHGRNARQMYRSLRGACANAASREQAPISLSLLDIEAIANRKGIGF